MKLTDLNPVWVSLGGSARRSGFTFDCPCCRKVRLTCKSIPAGIDEQETLHESMGTPYAQWVPARDDAVWQWSSEDFNQMTVEPSIDASDSGHWHGRIQGGEVK